MQCDKNEVQNTSKNKINANEAVEKVEDSADMNNDALVLQL